MPPGWSATWMIGIMPEGVKLVLHHQQQKQPLPFEGHNCSKQTQMIFYFSPCFVRRR